jgi:hypothetical protein
VRGKLARMPKNETSIVSAAERFVWHAGRVLERLRFEHAFRGGDAGRVVLALRPYQNPDGGFGQGLEPDFRGPVSQPLCVDSALRALTGIRGAQVDALLAPMFDYLVRISGRDGGVPNVVANVADYPRAPWWSADPEQASSLLPTASIAGLLYQRGSTHAWLRGASEFCFDALTRLPERLARAQGRLPLLGALYELRAGMMFLDHVPDRARAELLAATLGRALLDRGVIDPESAGGEMNAPLDYATTPRTLARTWFDDAQIARQLEVLRSSQREDGGFPIGWEPFTPAAGWEWRAIVTIERLETLRAYDAL